METDRKLFEPGANVIYGLLGRCVVESIESRTVGDQSVAFYKLQPAKTPLARGKALEPAIWLPVEKASSSGLRQPLSEAEFEKVQGILQSAEYYLPLKTPFREAKLKTEEWIRLEGACGLAKTLSYLFVLKNSLVVAPSEVQKHYATVLNVLVRELAELRQISLKDAEGIIEKPLRQKLRADH